MSSALILLCSPRRGGTSDLLADFFVQGWRRSGGTASILALREYAIRPCRGCGACEHPPHGCPLGHGDDTDTIFAQMQAHNLVFMASPIYFYGLPAHAKGLLDRSQRFWWTARTEKTEKAPLLLGLVAARSKGEQLFTGSILGVRHFAAVLGRHLAEERHWRGLENAADWQQYPEDVAHIRHWGHSWGCQMRCNNE